MKLTLPQEKVNVLIDQRQLFISTDLVTARAKATYSSQRKQILVFLM